MLDQVKKLRQEVEQAKQRRDNAAQNWHLKSRDANAALQEYLAADDAFKDIAGQLKGMAGALQWELNELMH